MATRFRNLVEKKEKKKTPIEFTHILSHGNWAHAVSKPKRYDNVDYIGTYSFGDLFLAWNNNSPIPVLYKGHLNDGFIADEE